MVLRGLPEESVLSLPRARSVLFPVFSWSFRGHLCFQWRNICRLAPDVELPGQKTKGFEISLAAVIVPCKRAGLLMPPRQLVGGSLKETYG